MGSTDELKIVLTWGETPLDLDSHLYTPLIDGLSYHIYYLDKGTLSEVPYACLDIDDMSSYGPETIWIETFYPGTYIYKVYNFSGTESLTTSSASVSVIDRDGVIATFDVPTTGTGLWWTVFEIDGATMAITPINTIGD